MLKHVTDDHTTWFSQTHWVLDPPLSGSHPFVWLLASCAISAVWSSYRNHSLASSSWSFGAGWRLVQCSSVGPKQVLR